MGRNDVCFSPRDPPRLMLGKARFGWLASLLFYSKPGRAVPAYHLFTSSLPQPPVVPQPQCWGLEEGLRTHVSELEMLKPC